MVKHQTKAYISFWLIYLCVSRRSSVQGNKPSFLCNCAEGRACPFQGRCQRKNVVYRAIILWTAEDDTKHSRNFIGFSVDSVKDRYMKFESAMAVYAGCCKSLPLMARHAWDLKHNNIDYQVSWEILTEQDLYEMVVNQL